VAIVVVLIVDPVYKDVMVVYRTGTYTIMAPVCPGIVGVATVDVMVVEPVYKDVTVVNWRGI
jgi:hypothetical protein